MISRVFIERPIFAWVLAIVVMLGGLFAMRSLPVSQYPNVAPPNVSLRASYPDLTPKQERLCGLIRAGLSSREISTLMDLEAEGLKAQRKRLRKRLNLQPDERLEMVLAGV